MNKQSTVLALDLGDKRHGVAIAHLPTKVALPQAVIPQSRHFLADLGQLHAEYNFELVVVGLPLTLTGTHSPQTAKVEKLAAQISQHLGIPVVFEDERFTTRQAQSLFAARKKDSTAQLDSIAAQLILEQWLARHP